MKVEVDQVRCSTAGMCVKICPEVFRFQEGSKKAIAIPGDIPPELVQKCIKAATSCPNEAIVIKD